MKTAYIVIVLTMEYDVGDAHLDFICVTTSAKKQSKAIAIKLQRGDGSKAGDSADV